MHYRQWISAIISGCVALVATVAIIAASEVYVQYKQIARIKDPTALFGIGIYGAYIVVQSVDVSKKTVVAGVKSVATGQDIVMRLRMVDDRMIIQRRDPIFEDNVLVGMSPIKPATIDDLKFGTRGTALLHISQQDGMTYIIYLLIGDPYPRP